MTEDKLSEIAASLKELVKWSRVTGMKEVKNVLVLALDSDPKKIIYHLSDGEKGSAEIAIAAGVSDWTVRNYWKSWNKMGIVEPLQAGSGQRYKKSFEIEDFGIEVPKIATAKTPPKATEPKEVSE